MTTYNIPPVAKPRMTQRDKWAKRPAVIKYRQFCDRVRFARMQLYPCGLHITFVVPMPGSWSERKKAAFDGQPHQQRPDLDNYLKAVLDAVYSEDSHIWDMRITKIWGREGKIIVEKQKATVTPPPQC